jgi:hypothetical protein
MTTQDVTEFTTTTANQHQTTASKQHASDHPKDAYDTSGTSPSVAIHQHAEESQVEGGAK